MKRPILIAVIGYIIGIIVGLYIQKSIVLLYFFITAIYLIYKYLNKKQIKKLKIFSIKRYFRYIKIYINLKVLILLVISSILSNTIIILKNKDYQKIYENLSIQENIELTGKIVSDKEERQYNNKYKIIVKYNNKKLKFYITTKKQIDLQYGDTVKLSGIYIKPEIQRNYKGFNYQQYLKQLKIYGTIKCEKIDILSKNQGNNVFLLSNKISNIIKSNVRGVLNDEYASILLGLVLGDKTYIDQSIQENFKNANMAHILAVSGMHVTYMILGINIILKNIIGKKLTNIVSIIILLLYMFITNFSPSITRAGIMGIIMITSKIIYRKNDIFTSISISLLVILIYNPYLLQNLGLCLSYGGVCGIIICNKVILKFLKSIKIKNKFYKYKIRPKFQNYIDKIKEILSVTISVQLFILPIIFYNMNIFNPYFLVSNLILSAVIGPIVILSFIFIIITLINMHIAIFFSKPVGFSIQILEFISRIGLLPFSKFYIPTPSLFSIIIYYFFVIVLLSIFQVYSAKNPNKTQIRIKNLIAMGKIKLRKNIKIVKVFLIFLFIFIFLIKLYPKNLKIYFIDVGQGDSTLIVTPQNKTILVDGGGSVNSDFDVGKSTLVPYILDRGFVKIDTIIISHFDNDHVGGLLTVLQELKVSNVIIGKQFENSENYQKFLKIVKDKKINVNIVNSKCKINVEKNLYLDVLWPNDFESITENSINNNALVFKLYYKNFSMLFTGDIEKEAEDILVSKYKETDALKSTVLKVGHHGSKSSSTEQFLKLVSPKIALIGVGKNNRYGHPNMEVMERFQSLRS